MTIAPVGHSGEFCVEALWKPQPPGFDPARSAKSGRRARVIGLDLQTTRSRPLSLGLCKQEVAGSSPAGSTKLTHLQAKRSRRASTVRALSQHECSREPLAARTSIYRIGGANGRAEAFPDFLVVSGRFESVSDVVDLVGSGP